MSKQRISILASAIVAHVLDNGGWLGASWPLYIKGPKLNHEGEYHAAYMLAARRAFDSCGVGLMQMSQYNFASQGTWDEVPL
jgi:hypothetical protein